MKKKKKFETEAVRTQSERSEFLEHSAPLYLTSSFIFEDAEDMRASFAEEKTRNIYSRFSNPNTSEFVEKVCKMEGAEDGFAFATGMAAVFSTFAALLKSGDHIVSARSVFGSTHTIFTKFFPKWNITTSYGDVNDVDSWEALIQPNTKFIYAETPTNPSVDIIDLEKVSALAKLIVDNCFATPYLQQPIKFGADLVIHSATKFMDGQGRVLGGITVGPKDLIKEIYIFSRNTGPALSPFNAWVLSKSLETLAVRMDRHSQNALQLAEYLQQHKEVSWVKYPFLKSHPQYEVAKKQMTGGGGVVAFELKGGVAAGRKFLDALDMISLSANLGDTRTIATHPASTTHSKLTEEERLAAGITPGLVRISTGLEHIDDIIADVEQAL
jgi:O-succinylhomoserine sulfhydrylase